MNNYHLKTQKNFTDDGTFIRFPELAVLTEAQTCIFLYAF